ncbi:DUF4430 domain-containing protein [Inconstantimicrobium mannanitabidum]|uniref:Uncharacterized protein n=1 Tax=Inconstantimicrobium mannanitabidum TaxID=1604901 RepID=A0ACB5RCZ4_9CLOT|nr:DUF4430 domain-containing protein [Clostridium sp. TW13]GKX67032.1 hypothetical protein rsdtw13_22900 [Clostridium sp. TW13]
MKKKKSIVLLLIGIISLSLVIYFGSNAIKNSLNEPTTSTTAADNKSKQEVTAQGKQDDSKGKPEATDSKNSDSSKQEASKENQDKKEDKQTTTDTSKKATNNNNVAKSSGVKTEDKTQTNTASKSSDTAAKKPAEVVYFTIIDDVHDGKILLNTSVNFDGSLTLEDYMNKLIGDQKHRIVNGYVSSMFDLKERGDGPLSGWVYYLNGVKPGYGISDCTPKAGDKIVWKYVKDGVNN